MSEVLLDTYSGGAHCCYSLYIGSFIKGKFKFTDSLYLGNPYYEVTDLNKDGRNEIENSNDMFAYAFTNCAESRFPAMIYKYDAGKLVNVTSEYKDIIIEELDGFLAELRSMTDTGFKCESIDEDTFNTAAGSVKTVLAAIVADYYTLGEVQKGYEMVDSVYKCSDRDKFKKILVNDYKLK
jgi:hypothetical protein